MEDCLRRVLAVWPRPQPPDGQFFITASAQMLDFDRVLARVLVGKNEGKQ